MAFRVYKSIRLADAIEFIDIDLTASDVGVVIGAVSAANQVLLDGYVAGDGGVNAGAPVRTTANAADTVVHAGNSAATAADNVIGIATSTVASGVSCTIIALGNLPAYSTLPIGGKVWLGSQGSVTTSYPAGVGKLILGQVKNSTTLSVRIGELKLGAF